jgi:hypothetical protein
VLAPVLLLLQSLTSVGLFPSASVAHAGELDLSLSRLSQGDCASTFGEGAVLSRDGAPTLRPDGAGFRELVAQLGTAIGPVVTAPVITSGPTGMEVSMETTITGIARDASYWRRAAGGLRDDTCAARNAELPPNLVTNRVHFEKGLPFGLSVGAQVGTVHRSGMYLVGADVKLALFEEVWRSRVPDLALRAALTRLAGSRDLSLYVTTVDAVLSERYVLAHALQVSPFFGLGALWTRADTRLVDLTPNIDALACRAGSDPVCNAAGLGASSDDLAHDVKFPRVSQLRYRAFAGLWLRYGPVSLSGSLTLDARTPHVGERGKGPASPRQWTVDVSPSVIF